MPPFKRLLPWARPALASAPSLVVSWSGCSRWVLISENSTLVERTRPGNGPHLWDGDGKGEEDAVVFLIARVVEASAEDSTFFVERHGYVWQSTCGSLRCERGLHFLCESDDMLWLCTSRAR